MSLEEFQGLIAIAGLVGVGKTTLAENLGRCLGASVIREEYDLNPFLPQVLAGRKELALASELFFLFSRLRQLDKKRLNEEKILICDYVFEKNRVFAEINLNPSELMIYDQIEAAVTPQIAQPAILIYLHDTVDNCLERISRRGRDMERQISRDWLLRLQAQYEKIFRNWESCPVLHLDCGRYDCRMPAAVEYVGENLQLIVNM